MHIKTRALLSLAAFAVFGSGVCAAADQASRDRAADVYIVGALHGLHEREDSFDYAALSRVIDGIDPEVLVLEVRPDELTERKDTPGRPEYPKTVWPWLRGKTVAAIALELGNPEFTRRVTLVGERFAAFKQGEPRKSAWWSSYQTSLEQALLAHWRRASQTHDRVTEDLARSYYLTQYAVLSSELQQLQEQWDEEMVALARAAVRDNPDKKVLILVSYRNRHRFVDAIRLLAPERLVDMERWLRASEGAGEPGQH